MHRSFRPHYAWIVCLGGAMSMFLAIGFGANLFPYCLPDILDAEGFTNTQGSLLSTVRTLTTILSLLVVTRLVDRFSPRAVCAAGALMIAVSCLCCALSSSFAQYCASYALMGVGYCLGGAVPVSLMITRWFDSRRSLAQGLATASVGLPPLLLPPALAAMRARGGLSAEFLLLAGLALALGVLSFLLLRSDPASMGMEPYREAAAAAAAAERPDAPDLSRPQLWLVLLAALMGGAPGGAAFNFVAVYLQGEGYDPAVVTALVSFMGLVIMVGKLPCGMIYDKLGGFWGHVYVYGAMALSQALFLLAPLGSVPLAFACILFFGLGLPVGTVTVFRWAGDLFPREKYASAVRSGTLAFVLGMMLFTPLGGAIADRYGSYRPAYLVYLLLTFVSAALLLGVYRAAGAGRAVDKTEKRGNNRSGAPQMK